MYLNKIKMNKKLILPITLILLFGLSFVYAAQGPFYTPDPVSFEKGWNLLYGFADPQQLKEYGVEGSIKAVYAFIPTIQEYARTWPNPESDKVRLIDDDELLNTAFWVYSDVDMNTRYHLLEEVIPFNKRPIYKGWNFFGITPEMKGVPYKDFKGNCNILKLCEYQRNNWDCVDGASWNPNNVMADQDADLMKGLIMKVSNNCDLGGAISQPPSLPS